MSDLPQVRLSDPGTVSFDLAMTGDAYLDAARIDAMAASLARLRAVAEETLREHAELCGDPETCEHPLGQALAALTPEDLGDG